MSSLVQKTVKTIKEDGLNILCMKAKKYIKRSRQMQKDKKNNGFKDVLFIKEESETVPHPLRYRVSHQREQLSAFNIESDEIDYHNLDLEQVRLYNVFIIFRCPYTEKIGEFVYLAKKMNKKVIYDIDDLVIDLKYTNQIKYLNTMTLEDRKQYNDGVERMGKLLCLCDAAITTTMGMKQELSKYVKKVIINRNVASQEMVLISEKSINLKTEKQESVKIGYFSGSDTHLPDFQLVSGALFNIMQKYQNVELYIVGKMRIENLEEVFKKRIHVYEFVDWKKLPSLISEVDINIAPLEDTVFNRAKSENKWMEAALVKVPTIASNIGAFAETITNMENGILCENNEESWYQCLEKMILDSKFRHELGEKAYSFCRKNYETLYTGKIISEYIRSEEENSIAFFLPSLEISGGVRVALKHAIVLQKYGKSVSLIIPEGVEKSYEFEGHEFPVLVLSRDKIKGRFHKIVATMWTTMLLLDKIDNVQEKYYLVQNFETDFYEPGNKYRAQANLSYSPISKTQFLTISKWCQRWLRKQYGKQSRYVPNGIDLENFWPCERDYTEKIRILIEGDCNVEYKNVDESFEIVQYLDPNVYEIWYMSYNGEPKKKYRVDQFWHKIPYEKVSDVYRQCHILLKTSLLESFSYPPLEMMATGGISVVIPNDGNIEYLEDEVNCIMIEHGKPEKSARRIDDLCGNSEFIKKLTLGGHKTASSREWSKIEKDVVAFYN